MIRMKQWTTEEHQSFVESHSAKVRSSVKTRCLQKCEHVYPSGTLPVGVGTSQVSHIFLWAEIKRDPDEYECSHFLG